MSTPSITTLVDNFAIPIPIFSPYQEHELLRAEGETVAKEQGVEFYYEDFRTGFRESHRLSRELNLYRQKYCGCVYSEWERYGKVKIS